MNKVLFDQLNSVYTPMWNKAVEVKDVLKAAGFSVSLGFYNNHYVKDGNGFVIENFPIPVIAINKIGEIGIDIDSYWVEVHLVKSKAASLDYPKLTRLYNIEVYGSEDFCQDFYNKESNPDETAEKIRSSGENLINIAFYFDTSAGTTELVNIIQKFV